MQDAARDMTPETDPLFAGRFIDIVALTEPLGTDRPTGPDLREDAQPNAPYYQLRDARSTARNNERAALAEGEAAFISAGDWRPVQELACQILSSESKDLEVVAWLIEALTRVHGYAGAADGFALAEALISRYGDTLHPLPDDEGRATQVAALTGLNGLGTEGALITPLKAVPLTSSSASTGPFAVWQCEQAFELERTSDATRKAQREERGFASRSDIDQAVAESEASELRAHMAGLGALRQAFEAYQNTLDAYCADDPQPTGRLHDTIELCEQILRYVAGDKLADGAEPGELPAAAQPPATGEAAEAQQPAAAGSARPGAPANRQAAVAQLSEIAAFFRRTEPHSPMSYAIEQVVRWSELALPDLIAELIPDENARQKYRTLAGIPASGED